MSPVAVRKQQTDEAYGSDKRENDERTLIDFSKKY